MKMKNQFEHLESITDREMYDKAMAYFNQLMEYATRNGYLSSHGNDNEYTRELGRIGVMCTDYESLFMEFAHLKVKPLLYKARL